MSGAVIPRGRERKIQKKYEKTCEKPRGLERGERERKARRSAGDRRGSTRRPRRTAEKDPRRRDDHPRRRVMSQIGSVAPGGVPASGPNPAAAVSAAGASNANPFASLTSGDEFLQLLVAQLQHQDPMNPMSPTSLMAQTAQLAMVQDLQQVESEMTTVQSTLSTLDAAGLVGRTVTATSASGTQVSGVVSGVRVSASGVDLEVDGSLVPLSGLQSIAAGASSSAVSGDEAGTS